MGELGKWGTELPHNEVLKTFSTCCCARPLKRLLKLDLLGRVLSSRWRNSKCSGRFHDTRARNSPLIERCSPESLQHRQFSRVVFYCEPSLPVNRYRLGQTQRSFLFFPDTPNGIPVINLFFKRNRNTAPVPTSRGGNTLAFSPATFCRLLGMKTRV